MAAPRCQKCIEAVEDHRLASKLRLIECWQDGLMEIVDHTAVELAGLLRSRELSARDVLIAHLERIDQVNPQINAIVSMRDRADVLADADAADAQEPMGPLHGLPVAVKDLEDVSGLPTRAGSLVTSTRPAAADGFIAAQLRAAGAIIIGKTNTPEFGTGSHTFNEVFGVTRNPWDPSKSAGGSSGGAAAALASRMLPIADGSDLGGSLRNPAAFCNVVGLRPTIGRVALSAATSTSTHLMRLSMRGPMGRTVADTALLLSVLAGPQADDPLSLADEPATFSAPLSTTTSARLAWGGDLGLFTAEAEVLGLCRQAAKQIAAAGGTFSEAAPDLSGSMQIFRTLRGLAYRQLGQAIPRDRWRLMKATVVENIEFGQSITVDDVLQAEALRAQLHVEMTKFFDEYDVLALPAAQVAPFPVETEFPMEIDGIAMGDYLDWMTTCCIITPTGCPALSLPAGFTSAGLPVGLQLVARVGNDRALLEAAAALEAANPQYQHVPGLVMA